jgi:hypothetical protein
MAKVLILYYSSYGHIERMGQAECQGARSADARTTKDGTLPRSRRVATVCDGPIRACVLLAASPRLRSEERSVPRQQRVGVRSPSFAY